MQTEQGQEDNVGIMIDFSFVDKLLQKNYAR